MGSSRRIVLLVVLLTAVFNLIPLASQFWLDTYDGETHLFFADHYRRGWWDAWEEKWLQGFWVYSYPPLVHQLIALTGRLAGLETAYRFVQLVVVCTYPLGIWLLGRELFGAEAADGAALLTGLPAGIYLALYSFGQLPTVAGTVLSLLALTLLARYLRGGRARHLLAWAALAGATFSAHHFTAVFLLVPAAAGIAGYMVFRDGLRSRGTPARLVLAAGALAIAAGVAIIPFWWWWFTQRAVVAEIPHPTRLAFLPVPEFRDLFFLRVYGLSLIALPFALLWFLRRRSRWPLAILMAGWTVLGLGGNTALPRLALGGLWSTLVYDRFALMAAALIPLAGGDWLASLPARARRVILVTLLVPAAVLSAGAAEHARNSGLLPLLQPWERAEMRRFLEADNHANWYYITLGLGDNEFQHLSRITSARTIDGYYTTARRRRELRDNGISTFDAAMYFSGGRRAVQAVLRRPEAWSLKWALVRDARFDPLLTEAGWKKAFPIGSDATWKPGDPVYSAVMVWHYPGKVPGGAEDGPQVPWALPLLWGILPIICVVVGIGLLAFDRDGRGVSPG